MSSSSSYSNPPCAACKFLRRKCLPSCIFAPYFSPEEPIKFTTVHKVFGASNVSKLLNEIQPHQREDAVNSLVYEAEARLKDPVYGCVGAISVLQRQVIRLQKELDSTNADLLRYTNYEQVNNNQIMVNQERSNFQYGRRMVPSYSSSEWNSGISGDQNNIGIDGGSGR
ncbi:LOB domain-containing protein 25-like [Lycium ferocissimum]|uniref:LOB domain-containing protein 25-like n=1 Tax=Lycium ferocissimum TaxID=112874 RepID=UPI002815A5AF|nr:LOB domain-containing protein 25-like [Lycium ferocissimum]XP_059284606.1 LOB domain-containing protein 25-like [Lycium ferocissimum]XP_059284617.1 LOB domain-containing protein 25-like [Lycium ferocissimum]